MRSRQAPRGWSWFLVAFPQVGDSPRYRDFLFEPIMSSGAAVALPLALVVEQQHNEGLASVDATTSEGALTLMNAHRSIFFSGKDGEKFCDFNDAPTIKKYIGMFPMSQRTLIWLKLSYAGMQAYFSLHGIPYLVMFIPDKTTLYPEWLPEWINWARTKSHYEQIVPILANNRINFFDFLPVLQRHKNELRLYDQRYDIGHWNGNALDIAYQEAGKILNRYGIPVDQAQLKQAYAVKNVDLHFFCIGDEKVPMVEYTPNSDVVNVSDDLASLQHLPEQYKPQLFVNKKVSDHTLWVASDSYFAATHAVSAGAKVVSRARMPYAVIM